MSAKNRSKKNLLIMPGFQGRMIFFVVLSGFACTLFNGYLYYEYVSGSYDFVLKHSTLSQDLITQRYDDLLRVGLGLGTAALLLTLLIAVWALVISHRAAGAVYHISRVVNEVRAGNATSRVRLRKKDEFQGLAQSFNAMLDELQRASAQGPS